MILNQNGHLRIVWRKQKPVFCKSIQNCTNDYVNEKKIDQKPVWTVCQVFNSKLKMGSDNVAKLNRFYALLK